MTYGKEHCCYTTMERQKSVHTDFLPNKFHNNLTFLYTFCFFKYWMIYKQICIYWAPSHTTSLVTSMANNSNSDINLIRFPSLTPVWSCRKALLRSMAHTPSPQSNWLLKKKKMLVIVYIQVVSQCNLDHDVDIHLFAQKPYFYLRLTYQDICCYQMLLEPWSVPVPGGVCCCQAAKTQAYSS